MTTTASFFPDVKAACAAAEVARDRVRPVVVALGVNALALVDVYLTSRAPVRLGVSRSGLLFVATSFLTGVLWVRWFAVVYDGVRALRRARYLQMWAVLAWLLPYAYLFVPKQLVNDLWRPGAPPRAVQAWWVLWLSASALMAFANVTDRSMPGEWLWQVTVAGLLVATPFAVLTVRAVTDRLEALVGALETA